MAKSKKPEGPKGTVDGVTYYNYMGEPRVRKKSSLTGERVKSDPAFVPTLQAGSRFIKLVRAVKAIRYAISPFAQAFGDGMLHQRLISALNKAVKRDGTIMGENGVDYFKLEKLLMDFEFMPRVSLEKVFRIDPFFTASNDKTQVALEVLVEPMKVFRSETNATHFRIMLLLAPVGRATTLRVWEDEDLGPQATVATQWFSEVEGCDLRVYLPIPEFMRGKWPILAVMIVEKGLERRGVVTPMEDGNVMVVMGMV